MSDEAAHNEAEGTPLKPFDLPLYFHHVNVLVAITLPSTMAVWLFKPAGSEQRYFLIASAFVFLTAAVAGGLLKRKLNRIVNAASIQKVIQETAIARADTVAALSRSDFQVNPSYLIVCMYTCLILTVICTTLGSHYLAWLAVLISGEGAYLCLCLELCKNAEELKSIADDWSQQLARRPDAKLKRVCADRARELLGGVRASLSG